MRQVILIALCALCLGAAPRKPGVYTVTIKVDTTYVKTGATEDGVPLFRQKIDTTETWASHQDIADSVWGQAWKWQPVLDSLKVIDVPLGCLKDTDIAW